MYEFMDKVNAFIRNTFEFEILSKNVLYFKRIFFGIKFSIEFTSYFGFNDFGKIAEEKFHFQ